MSHSNHDQVSLATKLAYGIGALTDSLKAFSFTTFLLFYYTTVLGLPGMLLGLAMTAGLLWDASVDPLIGHLSDRATFRFGRRHTFMFLGAIGAGASFVAIFNPPAGLSHAALFAWLMVSSLCLRSTISLFLVPYYALGAELTSDYHERTSISAYRAGAVLVGTLVATAVAFLVFLPSSGGGGPDAKFSRDSYGSIGVAFGIAITVVGLTATLGTLRERHRSAPAYAERGAGLGLPRTLLETLRNRPFRVLLAASALSVMAATMNAALAMHYLTYHARISASHAVTLYFNAFYIGALTGVLVWARVARRIAKQHVYAGTTVMTALVVSGGYWLVGDGRPFGTGQLPLLLLLNGLTGLVGIGSAVLAPSMMADITARDEVDTGRRRDGAFFGIYSFAQQLSTGVAVLVAGVLIDRFARLVPGQAEQSAATVERLVIVSNVLPAVLLVGAGLIAMRYRLTEQEVQPEQREPAGPAGPAHIPAQVTGRGAAT